MRKSKVEVLKRKIFIEEKMQEYKEQSTDTEVDMMYIYRMIQLEKEIKLDRDDIDYLISAKAMPIEEIEEQLNKYDSSSPKMDATVIINDLMNKYDMPKNTVIQRIHDVRQINKYYENPKRKTKKK